MRVVVDKYEFSVPEGDYRVHIKRCGDDWATLEVGSKAVAALMDEFEELRKNKAYYQCKLLDHAVWDKELNAGTGVLVAFDQWETIVDEIKTLRESLQTSQNLVNELRNNVRQAVHAFAGHSEEAENLKDLVLEQLYP